MAMVNCIDKFLDTACNTSLISNLVWCDSIQVNTKSLSFTFALPSNRHLYMRVERERERELYLEKKMKNER